MFMTYNKGNKILRDNVLNRKPYIGVSYPNLKLIAKRIQKANATIFLETNDFSVYELDILQTYVIGYVKDFEQAIKYFKLYAPLAKEWSVVDSLCQKFVITKKYPKEVFDLLIKYATENDEYKQRIVAVMLLSHFMNDDYIDDAIKLINQLKNQGYYCKMAVAWALATMMAKYQEKCMIYFLQNKLDKWTHNKAIQKMLESFRITDELKVILKQLKR